MLHNVYNYDILTIDIQFNIRSDRTIVRITTFCSPSVDTVNTIKTLNLRGKITMKKTVLESIINNQQFLVHDENNNLLIDADIKGNPVPLNTLEAIKENIDTVECIHIYIVSDERKNNVRFTIRNSRTTCKGKLFKECKQKVKVVKHDERHDIDYIATSDNIVRDCVNIAFEKRSQTLIGMYPKEFSTLTVKEQKKRSARKKDIEKAQ